MRGRFVLGGVVVLGFATGTLASGVVFDQVDLLEAPKLSGGSAALICLLLAVGGLARLRRPA